MATKTRIFIAHAAEDKPQIRSLYNKLKERGFNPWLDEVDLLPGQIWKEEIPKAITEAGVFLACLSARSVDKVGYVQYEFRRALSAFGERPPGSIYLIPVRLDECEIPDLKIPDLGLSLKEIQWVDLWEKDGLDRLVRSIKRALGGDETSDAESPSVGSQASKETERSTADATEAQGLLTEKPRFVAGPKDSFPRRHSTIVAVIIGAIALVAATLLGLPFLEGFLGKDVPIVVPSDPVPPEPQVRPLDPLPPKPASFPRGAKFNDCKVCPEMVVILSGQFKMGSKFGPSREKPQISKSISSAFALGRFEVTESEWLACQREGTCREFLDRETLQPVNQVSWYDASTYAAWLARTTGKPYRLPSETEWEYAARSGTSSTYPTGSIVLVSQANFGSSSGERIPVGQYPANSFGASDMLGNVWEWVADCAVSYNFHSDGTDAVTENGCDLRVLRGGGWRSDSEGLRSANRYFNKPDSARDDFGFRVARDLNDQEIERYDPN